MEQQLNQSHGRSMTVRLALITTVLAGFGFASTMGTSAIAQPPAAAPIPSFEVVSIRPSDPKIIGWNEQLLPDKLILSATAQSLIDAAYGIRYQFVFGGPDWVQSAEYTITAKMDDSVAEMLSKLPQKERYEQVNRMLLPILEDRFKLKVRHETKQLPIYALVVAKNGPKITPSPPLSPNASPSGPPARMDGKGWTIKREPMSFWVLQLAVYPEIGRMVVDETGLKGDYQFTFNWQPTKDDSGPTIFTALEEQLGLKLEPRKGPVDTIVIEHVERPSEN